MERREFLSLGMQTAAAATVGNLIINEAQAKTRIPTSGSYATIFPPPDQFVQEYLKDMPDFFTWAAWCPLYRRLKPNLKPHLNELLQCGKIGVAIRP